MKRAGQPAELATADVMLADPMSSYTSPTTVGAASLLEFRQRERYQHGTVSGPEILGAVVHAGDVLDVGVERLHQPEAVPLLAPQLPL